MENIVIQHQPRQSDQLNDLFAALAKAQGEMEVAGLNAVNSFLKSKYSDLPAVVKAARPYLTKNGLSVIQLILEAQECGAFLHTRLCHSSGQWIESRVRINPAKTDIQSFGSYITYLKRYSYAALVGVVSSDEDDDGEKAMSDVRDNRTTDGRASEENVKESESLLKELESELGGYEDLLKQVKSMTKRQKLEEIPSREIKGLLVWIRNVKKERNVKNENPVS